MRQPNVVRGLRVLSAILGIALASACAPPTEPTGTSQEQLVQYGEFARWYTVVFDQEELSLEEQYRYRQAFRAAGASGIVFLRRIGVAFVRLDDPGDIGDIGGVVGVLTAGRSAMYTLAGMPSIDDVRRGEVDLESIRERRAQRRPHRGPAAPAGDRAPTAADTLFDTSWGLHRIHAPEAWARTTGSHRTVVAVIDTGVANNHPDLSRNVIHRSCFHFSSLTGGEACNPYPMFQHGTHVAGIAAAQFGGGEAVGVGPNLGIASYNVFEPLLLTGDADGDGDYGQVYYPLATDVQIFSAIIDAVDRNYEVINMSLGGVAPNDGSAGLNASIVAWERAVRFATRRGTTVVVAAGNEGDWVDSNGTVVGNLDSDDYVIIPAETPGVITVGATGYRRDECGEPYDIVASYSNYGRRVDIAAPGGDNDWGELDPAAYLITSTEILADSFEDSLMAEVVDAPFVENPCYAAQNCEPGYLSFLGTSMASPFVAGAAGLLYERQGTNSLDPSFVSFLMRTYAQRGPDTVPLGAGIIDVGRLVR